LVIVGVFVAVAVAVAVGVFVTVGVEVWPSTKKARPIPNAIPKRTALSFIVKA
jgi:hypothetical protein